MTGRHPPQRPMMRGAFRGPERAKLRELATANIVPNLERKEIAPLRRFFAHQRGLTVLDIGARKGLWTRALLNVFGERIERVYRFEPSPENYRELTDHEDNFAGLRGLDFQRLSVARCAIGRAPGTATLYTNEDASPLASLYPHQHPGWGEAMKDIRLAEQLEVPVETIDRFLTRAEIPHVEITKICPAARSTRCSFPALRKSGSVDFGGRWLPLRNEPSGGPSSARRLGSA
jgi:FkbM family methyltransferase